MKLIKRLLMAIGAIVVIAIVGGVLLYMNLGKVLKSGIERFGPTYTGTSVTVESVSLSPFTGDGEIRGLVVGNPDGYTTEHAVRVDRVSLKVDVASLKSDKAIVRDITVENAEINYETGLRGGSNIKAIHEHVKSMVPQSESETKLQIDRLAFSGGTIHFTVKDLPAKLAPPAIALKPITLTDMGTGPDGVTPGEVIKKVADPLFGQIKDAAAGVLGKLPDSATGVLDGGKSLLDGAAGKLPGIPGLGGKKD